MQNHLPFATAPPVLSKADLTTNVTQDRMIKQIKSDIELRIESLASKQKTIFNLHFKDCLKNINKEMNICLKKKKET